MISYWGISLLIFSIENTWYRGSEYQELSLDISYYRTATRRISATAWIELIRLILRSYFQFLFSIYFSDYCLLIWGIFWKIFYSLGSNHRKLRVISGILFCLSRLLRNMIYFDFVHLITLSYFDWFDHISSSESFKFVFTIWGRD